MASASKYHILWMYIINRLGLWKTVAFKPYQIPIKARQSEHAQDVLIDIKGRQPMKTKRSVIESRLSVLN